MALTQQNLADLVKAGATRQDIVNMFGEEDARAFDAYQNGGAAPMDPWTMLTGLNTAGYQTQGAQALPWLNPSTMTPQQRVDTATSMGITPTQPLQQDAARYAQNQAIDQRFGSDMSWLDPSFQYNPALLGPSQGAQAYADPTAIARQEQAYNQLGELASTPMQWESPARQEEAYNRTLGVQMPTFDTEAAARQGQAYNYLQSIQGPQFESPELQTDVARQAGARAAGKGAPTFLGDVDQRQVFGELGDIAKSGGAKGIAYDSGANEAEQLGNLKDIIAGGGATTLEMAARQRQRADEESWLRGQQEALEQQMAQRGMAGSGQALVSKLVNQQGSAGRNSLADLDTAAALEKRRMEAITNAADLSSNIRRETADEQQFNAQRGDTALANAGNLATSMRTGDFQEKSYLDDAMLKALGIEGNMANALRADKATEELGRTGFELDQATGMGNLAGQMRDATYRENSFLTDAQLRQAATAADIANAMRADTYNENSFTRQNLTDLLQSQGTLATNQRNASFNEAFSRGSAADDFAQYNQDAINTAAQTNTGFLQDAYLQTQQQRAAADRQNKDLKVGAAGTVMGQDAANAQNDTNTYNNALANYRSDVYGIFGGYVPQPNQFSTAADTLGKVGTAVTTAYGGPAAGAAVSNATSQNGQTSLSQPGTTWASSSADEAGNIGSTSSALTQKKKNIYDPNQIYY